MTTFSFQRFFNLTVRKFYTYKKTYLAASITFFAINVVMNYLLKGLFAQGFWYIFAFAWTVCAGFIPFMEYKDKKDRVFQINLPATQTEKYFTDFLFVFIFTPIVIFVTECIGLYFGSLIANIVYGSESFVLKFSCDMINISWSKLEFLTILNFIDWLAVMFFGAIYFKKYRLLKTCVFIFTYTAVLTILFITIVLCKNHGSVCLEGSLFGYEKNLSIGMTYCWTILWTVFTLWMAWRRLIEERA